MCQTSFILEPIYLSRSTHQRCSIKTGVLRNFTKSQENTCARVSFCSLRPATLLKKRLWHRCVPVNFAKFLRAPFLQNTFGRLLVSIYEPRSVCKPLYTLEQEFLKNGIQQGLLNSEKVSNINIAGNLKLFNISFKFDRILRGGFASFYEITVWNIITC